LIVEDWQRAWSFKLPLPKEKRESEEGMINIEYIILFAVQMRTERNSVGRRE
jgi:hypothetical protein